MNFAHRSLLPVMMLALMALSSHAQEAAEEGEDKRVQYQLVLPEEKTPENVKPEERNPFESISDVLSRQSTGDTEENRVREKLLKLPVVGARRTNGRMRVLLGDIILETGCDVPPVLPDQMVELKVKNITPEYIELAWQEKRLTGLPPKLMTIPINISPRVRYQMFGQTEAEAKEHKGANATMNIAPREDTEANTAAAPPPAPADSPPPMVAPDPAPPRAQVVADDPLPFSPPRLVEPPPAAPPAPSPSLSPAPAPAQALTATPEKPLPPAPQDAAQPLPPPASPAVESVVRMLFGNPTPAPK
ncbi:MAG: hypothetical protein J0L73_24975 [Verrucomicrobia bacterium]|nr:hypothetical protein [Verrucomicrobiota bacterium]